MDWNAFFLVHDGLPREGPGCAADVAWAVDVAGAGASARVCDVGCGPGDDFAALRAAMPQAEICGIDTHARFVEAANRRHVDDPKMQAEIYDMGALPDHPRAPFDGIWSAGALYFLGLEQGPRRMAQALRPGGWLAFSEPCFFTESPSQAAQDMWDGYPTKEAGAIAKALEDQGFEVLGQRPVPDIAWEAYYQPMEARIAELRPSADAALTEMLDLCAQEAATWRGLRHETGYLLSVARLR